MLPALALACDATGRGLSTCAKRAAEQAPRQSGVRCFEVLGSVGVGSFEGFGGRICGDV